MARAWNVLDLDPHGPLERAVPRIALARLQETFSHETETLGGSAEGVHDMRVSARRLQAVLKMFRWFFPRKQLRSVNRRVDELVRVLGEVREIDVFLELLRQHRQALGIDDALAVDLLIARQEHRRRLARGQLEGAIRRLERKGFRTSAAEFFKSLE